MSNQPDHLYEFGPFRLDSKRPRLTRDGEIVSLTPKALEILSVLVESCGVVVEKEDLMRKVWPNTFVEEGNLSVHIFALRKALGESEKGHTYIETLPRLGYRFVGPMQESVLDSADLVVERHTLSQVVVEERSDSTHEKIIPVTQLTMPTRRAVLRRPIMVVVVLVALSVAVSLAYFRLLNHSKPPAATSEVKSIAVLPFKTLGEKTDDEYLGLGLADALITQIGRSQQITVPSTSTVLRQVESEADPLAVGKRLGVEGVLEGSVQRAGERLRVTVRLLRVSDGVSLWSGKFDEKFTDISAVQDSISIQVANALLLNPTAGEKQFLVKRSTENTEAYLQYLRGRYFWNKRTEESLRRAIESFQKAIELDVNFGLAYAGLADAYALLVWNIGPVNPELINKARIAARKALELDSTLAEAHASLGFTRCWYEWDWQGAETEFKKAIELNPNYATAHHWYGEFLVLMGRFDEGFRELKLAQKIDPLSLIINADIGKMHFLARQPDQSIEQLQKTIEMEPNFPISHLFLAMAFRHKGMYEDAFRVLEKEEKLSEGRTIFLAVLGYCYATSGRTADARKMLVRLKAQKATDFELAVVHVGLGEKDEAFEWLERAYIKRDPFLLYLKVDPNLDSLRSDPRFKDLLQRLNLG